jgi:hypothetical protein
MKSSCKNHSFKRHFAKFIVIAIIGISVLSGILMLLWNWLMPDLFPGIKSITYLQALGILLLSKILFSGFRHHPSPFQNRHFFLRNRMMSEEQQVFRNHFKNHFREAMSQKDQTEHKEKDISSS